MERHSPFVDASILLESATIRIFSRILIHAILPMVECSNWISIHDRSADLRTRELVACAVQVMFARTFNIKFNLDKRAQKMKMHKNPPPRYSVERWHHFLNSGTDLPTAPMHASVLALANHSCSSFHQTKIEWSIHVPFSNHRSYCKASHIA